VKKLSIGFIILAVFTGFFYYYFFTEDYHLNYDFNSNLQLFIDDFTGKIVAKNIKGNIQPQEFTSPTGSEDEMALLLKAKVLEAFSTLKNTEVVVEDKEREEIIARIKYMGKKSAFFDNINPYDLLGSFKTPNYFLKGNYSLESNGKYILFSISLKDLKAVQVLRMTSSKLLAPQYLRKMKIKKNVLFATTIAFSVLFVLYFFAFALVFIFRFRVRRRCGEIISQVEDLIEQKKFVAADGYIKYALRYDPENPHFHGLKTKLEALSFGNPRKAQIACELYSKIKESEDSSKVISSMYSEVLELKDYHPELKAISYKAENVRKSEEILSKVQKIIAEGKLKQAEEILERIEVENPELDFSEIRAKLEQRKGKAVSLFNKAIKELALCRKKIAMELLNEAKGFNCELPHLSELLNIIEGQKKVELIDQSTGKKFTLFPKKQITIGRSTECDIRLSNPLISRKHCRITVTDKVSIIEDLNSKNHTYIAGEKVKKQVIEDGDIIDLGRGVKFVAHIEMVSGEKSKIDKTVTSGREKRVIGFLTLKENNKEYVIVYKKFSLNALDSINAEGVLLVREKTNRIWINQVEIPENTPYPVLDGELITNTKTYKVEVIK